MNDKPEEQERTETAEEIVERYKRLEREKRLTAPTKNAPMTMKQTVKTSTVAIILAILFGVYALSDYAPWNPRTLTERWCDAHGIPFWRWNDWDCIGSSPW